MKRVWEPLAAIALAVVLQTTLGRISPRILSLANPFAWVVLYFAVLRHELYGAVMGTVCGLLQDSLSMGVFGVAGLTKTLLGFAAGYVSRKIDVIPMIRNIVFLLILAAFELVLWKLLILLLLGHPISLDGGFVLLQPFFTAFVGAVLIRAVGRAERTAE